ncbi:sulfatase-like hydrolase/transferase [Sporosarcina ureilytica]|uniref:Sulfatase N-terminal domain-containing protein n=1 Tax=Sporosarcina ureilytica TaxID=298596 RepID=A0A1D8JIG4_9BACL|nr:sulfatase-like hydrolase/transferase [Sporosarcina ureilytica]AOV08497.1 hypothetical protein BI350_13795 [Sporosarcina ureilytica]
MESLNSKMEYYSSLARKIELNIEENNLEQAREKLEEYSSVINNSAKYCYKAILLFQANDVEGAIQELKAGAIEHPFNFNIYYNLGFMYNAIQEVEQSLNSFFYAIKYGFTDENKELALSALENVIKENPKANVTHEKMNEMKKVLDQEDARVYPIDKNRESLIRKPQHVGTEHEYMVNMYKILNIADVDLNTRMFFKSELIKGKKSRNLRKYQTKGPVVIPISKLKISTNIEIKVNGKKFDFSRDKLRINQFHYIRITEPGEIEISSDSEIFIGDIIELEPQVKPEKLVLKIFIDGLSYQFLEKNGLKEMMPHTHKFFKKGFMAKNCYTVSEWTLPSKSSINTGVYATKHKILQPEHLFTFKESHKLLAEYFQEQGYYCTNISPNWRTTPTLGYNKGFNRMIYQNFLGGMDSKEIVMETIEHLMSFNKTNNFLAISLLDLHNVPDEIENHLFSQVNTDIKNRLYKNKIGTTSVQTKFDESKVAKYAEEIRRVDGILSVLYNYILKNYGEDEFVVTLHSDHGQTFLEEGFNLLSDNRLKVPFMMRGKNVPTIESEELIQTVDILPTILKSCGLESIQEIDGRIPKAFGENEEREFTFSQIIHPNQTYKVRINEGDISYYFETKHLVLADLSINLEGYQSRLVENQTEIDITQQNSDKKKKYDEYVFQQVKDMLRWSK